MAAPANDDKANAEAVSIGPYWGTLTGTTVEATKDGPFGSDPAQDVWYHWSSLPAGQVYFYIKPESTSYIEGYAWSSAPGDVTSTGDAIASFGNDNRNEFNRPIAQATHAGGALTLAVVTYEGAPGPIAFEVGWGHELDPTPSHWGEVQQDPWVETNVAHSNDAISKWGRCNYRADEEGPDIPPGAGPCVYENAADGVVLETATVDAPCTYIGPGVGTTDAGFEAGQRYTAGATGFITPSFPETLRSDHAYVGQLVEVKGFPANFNAPVTYENRPETFNDYMFSPGVRDSELGWGFEFHGDDLRRPVRNLDLGEFDVYNDYVHTPSGHDPDENESVSDPCDVKLVSLPDSVLWPTHATRNDAEDRVWLAYESNGDSYGSSFTWMLPETAAAGTLITALPDGVTPVVIADPLPYVHDFDGRKWLVTVAIAQQTMDETPPTFGDPTRTDDGFGVSYTADGTRRVVNPTSDESYETRGPDWRPYLGFPLDEVPTPIAGWHVGREALSGSGPW